jgi:hypothetical protein
MEASRLNRHWIRGREQGSISDDELCSHDMSVYGHRGKIRHGQQHRSLHHGGDAFRKVILQTLDSQSAIAEQSGMLS